MFDDEPTMLGQGQPMATLVVRQGTQAGVSFPIRGNQVIIGREEGLDVVLQDPEASRRHTRISWQGGRYVAEDMGSTNGSFVNGVQITAPQVLNPGDTIGIGQTAMVFQLAGSQVTDLMPGGVGAAQALIDEGAASAYNNAEGGSSAWTQYALYGCGCLLLLAICGLLLIVIWALAFTASFEEFTGLKISMQLVETYLNIG